MSGMGGGLSTVRRFGAEVRKWIASRVKRHAGSLFVIFITVMVLVSAIFGHYQEPLSGEEYRWKIEVFLQGSLVILGLLMIFATGIIDGLGKTRIGIR